MQIPDEAMGDNAEGAFDQTTLLLKRAPARRVAIIILLVVAGAAGGCVKAVEKEMTETVEQTIEMDPTGTLSVGNSNGSVRIYGSAAPEMKMTAIKRARTAKQLSEIKVDVTERSGAVTIDTKFAAQKKRSSSDPMAVDYTLVVPQTVQLTRLDVENGDVVIVGMRGEGLRANLVNGQLSAQNCFSNTQLSVGNGALHLSYDWWEQRSFSIHGQITEGNASASIPSRASFHLDAQSSRGKVINDFSETVELGGRSARRVEHSVGVGVSPKISLRATNGDIRIAGIEVN